jgi:hypothetical protein
MAQRETLIKRTTRTEVVTSISKPPAPTKDAKYDDDELRTAQYSDADVFTVFERSPRDWAVAIGLLLLSAALRFYKIYHPSQVVFDEVHFGRVRPLPLYLVVY